MKIWQATAGADNSVVVVRMSGEGATRPVAQQEADALVADARDRWQKEEARRREIFGRIPDAFKDIAASNF